MKGWWFSTVECTLGYGDGRKAAPGTTHTVDCEPVVCLAGLHAGHRAWDALQYASGPYIWRVELGGTIVHGDGKSAATERSYLWGYDATDVLRSFARRCALDVVDLWDCPDVVRHYLETGEEDMRSAAWDAARGNLATQAADAADWAALTAAWATDRADWAHAATHAAWAAVVAAGVAVRRKQICRLASMISAGRPK